MGISEALFKGYRITDGYDEMSVCSATRNKATGVFIAKYGRSCDWKRLRTTRAPELDGIEPWSFDAGAFSTVEFWGAPVRLP